MILDRGNRLRNGSPLAREDLLHEIVVELGHGKS
jgi:hypothetical protein